ncbi:MAG: DUF4011 domain-containing protein [Pseudorhodoplanes sp.]|jgi:very-short-patch-repair endonuclease|nr:DUF4011 domain-containing protein [Pseudorhodoplanes sp.]
MSVTVVGAAEPEDPAPAPGMQIIADIVRTFTFASHQNSIPVIRSLTIDNASNQHLENVTLEMTASPPFLRTKTWTFDRILSRDNLRLSDRRVELDANYLAGLDEAELGDVSFRLTHGDQKLDEKIFPVRLLARDEWGGVADMAQLLPAFVMPNDPAVSTILRSAAEYLAKYGHPSALDGYQSNDPRRAFMITAAIYSSIAALETFYAQPPASFERHGQKIRRPSRILEERLATCLDTSNLFAAALEGAGLNPVVLIFEGHAAVGVWLVKRTLPNTIENDAGEIRKAIAANELVVFETTGVAHRPVMMFQQAKSLCESRLAENSPMPFLSAIDISRSRISGIYPLASHAKIQSSGDLEQRSPTDVPLPPVPELGDMPADAVEQKPTTPAGRIDRWQTKLLDLSRRNRLINFSDTKRAVSFLCPDVAYLEDRLAEGAAVKLISLPEQNPLGERDAGMFRDMRGHDIHQKFAEEALQRDELASPLNAKELDARLTALYRQARSDIAEGGTNTLFLAVGLLKWTDKDKEKVVRRAPLLLFPVKLERTSAASRFRLRFHEDEPRLNQTLVQFVKREFDLVLPEFKDGLPSVSGNDVDVRKVLERMRAAVRDVPGFEIAEETALSTFSFAKYLMWKDLTDRTDALRQNRVVRHLIDNPEKMFEGADRPFPDEREIDRTIPLEKMVLPLSADSSQIAACIAAAQGRDFILIGPPGTGKSQTIANIIATILADAKRVLFVAEKTAALDVVYRRLEERGLAEHCLELHSNKADRKHFLQQLKRSWETGSSASRSDWISINSRLKVRRDQLNKYVEALHQPAQNGLTPYHAIGIAAAQANEHAPTLSWRGPDVHDKETYESLEALAAQLGLTFGAVRVKPALRVVRVREWTSSWQTQLLSAASTLGKAADDLREALMRWSRRLNLDSVQDTRLDGLKYFADLARNIISTSGKNFDVILDRNFSLLADALSDMEGAIASYRDLEAKLSAPYPRDELVRIPVEEIDRDWRAANAAMWPKSFFARRRIRRLLASYAGAKSVDPAIDIGLIRQMQNAASIVADNDLARTNLPVAGLDTNTQALRSHLDTAQQFRTAITQLGEFAGNMHAIATSIAANLTGEINLPQVRAAEDFLQKYRVLVIAMETFEAIAGATLPKDDEHFLMNLSTLMNELSQARSMLRDWSSWCDVRERAIAQGLGPLVEDLEAGAVLPEDALSAFRLGYARWWLPLIIDRNKVLRDFRRFEHEHAIVDFRAIDDAVREAASARVAQALLHNLPQVSLVPRNSELGRLRHQMNLQRPSASIRDMIGAMPETFGKLAPCVLMSPLSIAQYLPPNQELFDVVIFDEASQISTWDAVGAIARGQQTIIVGDPKQLPPTNFFGRSEDDDDDIPQHERDLESILDEACSSGLPTRNLRWHYRSRHESLIAFSNWHYYNNNLITFPSPVTQDQAVTLMPVPNGIYDRGKSRTNRVEAQEIVRYIASRLDEWLKLPEEERPTLGVITFNVQQQTLIQDLLDDLRREKPDFEWFFSDDRFEPVIVKNLENIQGDERDVMLFSITFGKDAAGKLPMDFGAINRQGGERRLNVAVTRARRELRVFSGIRADDIDLGRTKSLGVQHLKAFLDYAVRGAVSLPAQDQGSAGPIESPFEAAVKDALERRGWQVATQIGVSGFRIDLGVKHPDFAGSYLAGIECDGATYHSAATARDRDKVREQVLVGLGWKILRVWSTDWWFNTEDALDRLHQALTDTLTESRAKANAKP